MKIPRIAASTLVLAGLAHYGYGRPTKECGGSVTKRAAAGSDPTETQQLQLALTLENLENAFYHQGLHNYSASAFQHAGFPSWVRGRINEISQHEEVHVNALMEILGPDAVAPCTYSFPVKDPKGFVKLSAVLEGVGAAAYLGGGEFLTTQSTMLAAGAIGNTEARQNGWLTSAVMKTQPWSGPFETPLTGSQAFSLASQYIVDCPNTNPVLPFEAFPPLRVHGKIAPGSTVYLNFTNSEVPDTGLFMAFLTQLDTEYAPITNNQVTIPQKLQGTVYGVVVCDDENEVTDDNTVTSPAVFLFPYPSSDDNF